MDGFHYADRGDKLTDDLITRNFDGAYWGRSETRLLEEARAYISRKFGHDGQKKLRMLDLGCGMGRLIPEFAARYAFVTGLEPDGERCRQAGDFLQHMGVTNAEALNLSLEDYLAEQETPPRFDVVLCSHVFQHISHETVFGMLRDLARCTSPETVFIFTTTYIWEEENSYTLERFQGEERVSSVTDHAGFEEAVQNRKALAVCRFARPWLERELNRFGFLVRRFCCYHFYGEHNEENDAMNTLDPEKRKLARDAYYLCERSAAGETNGETPVAGKITYLQYYYLKKAPEGLPPEQKAEDAEPYRRQVMNDFKTSTDFLYGAGLHFPAKRYYSGDLGLSREGLPIRGSHTILSVYPDTSVCQVSVCLDPEETALRNFIWLHQIQASTGELFRMGDKLVSVPGICGEVLAQYGLQKAVASSTAIITELNRLGDHNSAEDLEDDAARCLYGVLTGDEGWHHVPVTMARRRMESSWGSRDFVKVVAFATNFLVLNLNREAVFRDYIEKQHGFADRYWGGLNPYFTMDAGTAGVNHGVYFSVETGMVVQTLTDRFLNSRPGVEKKNGVTLRQEIRENKHYRAELIRIMDKLERVNITELGELDNLVMRSLDTSERIESIRNILELLESNLDLLYQTNTNNMVNVLTVLGLLLSAAQVILAIFIR